MPLPMPDEAGDAAAYAGDSHQFGGVGAVQVDDGAGGVFVDAGQGVPSGLGGVDAGNSRTGSVPPGDADVGMEQLVLLIRQAIDFAEILRATETAAPFAVAHDVAGHPAGESQAAESKAVGCVRVEREGGERGFPGGIIRLLRVAMAGLSRLLFFLHRGEEVGIFLLHPGLSGPFFCSGVGRFIPEVQAELCAARPQQDEDTQQQDAAPFRAGEVEEVSQRVFHDAVSVACSRARMAVMRRMKDSRRGSW